MLKIIFIGFVAGVAYSAFMCLVIFIIQGFRPQKFLWLSIGGIVFWMIAAPIIYLHKGRR
jgi:hypothetical protein